jgi:hypothetical protein
VSALTSRRASHAECDGQRALAPWWQLDPPRTIGHAAGGSRQEVLADAKSDAEGAEMEHLKPKNHGEEVAVFRHGSIGELAVRELDHGERSEALRDPSAKAG